MVEVIVLEACDGFSLVILEQGLTSRYWFSQEDNKTQLVEFFKELGIKASYEEDC